MNTNKSSQLFLVILAALLLGACSRSGSSANAGKPPAMKVKLATVETAKVISSSEYVANLQSRRSVTLQPQIDGHVTQIYVQYGDVVPAGTPLIQIDPAQQQAAVNSSIAAAQAALANLQNAKATLSSLEAQRLSRISDLRYNERQYQRYSTLYAEGAVPQEQRDQYLDSLNTARANLNALDKQIQAQEATVAQAQKTFVQNQALTRQQQVQLQYYKITAPFTGIVGDIPVKLGDYVNTSTNLTTVTQNQPLEVNISVPIENAPKLHLGLPVELLNNQGQTVGTSQVFFIAPRTDNTTQSIIVKSLYENANNRLRANQYIRARVIWEQHPGVLVPTTAVSRIGGQNFVFVAQSQQDKQGKTQLVAQEKPVNLGDIQGNNYQVLSGIQLGEKIVVSGVQSLSNGAAILPQ